MLYLSTTSGAPVKSVLYSCNGVTAPHHGPYDFSCRRNHHGSLERASVVLSTDARLHWLCCALSSVCCVSPSNLPVKFCHTVNSELPWFQEDFVGYYVLVEKSSGVMTFVVSQYCFPHIYNRVASACSKGGRCAGCTGCSTDACRTILELFWPPCFRYHEEFSSIVSTGTVSKANKSSKL